MDENTSLILEESGIGVLRSLISAIPFAGTPINEILFDIRGRVRQERVNDFVESLIIRMKGLNLDKEDIKQTQFKDEEFGDFVEQLFTNVTKTKSINKLNGFKNLLINELVEPKGFEHSELMLNIINGLTEKQFVFMKFFMDKLLDDYNLTKANFATAIDDDKQLEEVSNLIEIQNKIKEKYKFEANVLSFKVDAQLVNNEDYFLMNDLLQKGLIYEDIAISVNGVKLYNMSRLGFTVMNYINEITLEESFNLNKTSLANSIFNFIMEDDSEHIVSKIIKLNKLFPKDENEEDDN